MSDTANDTLNLIDDTNPEWKRYAMSVSLAVALALMATLFWLNRSITEDNKNQAAMDVFTQAKTLEERQQAVEKYLGTPATAVALLDLAAEQYAKPDYAAAAASYEKFLNVYPAHPLGSAARLGLGSALEAAGKLPEAMKMYENVARTQPADIYNAPACLALARLHLQQKNTAAARQILEECLSKYAASSPFAAEARARLEKLPKS